MELLDALARQREHPAAESPVTLHEVAEMSRRRGLKVLVSDFYYPEEQLADVIAHFRHYQHELLLFHVLTPLEAEMPLEGQIRFRDSETGEEVVTQAEAIRDEFVAEIERWQGGLRRICSSHEIDYVPVTTSVPLPMALREYFQVRSQLF